MQHVKFFIAVAAAVLLSSLVPAGPAAAQGNQDWLRDVFGDSRVQRRETRVAPAKIDQSIDRPSRGETLVAQQTLSGLSPAIRRYDEIVRRGGWQLVPGRRGLRPGAEGERVIALRRRLIATGELNPASHRVAVYDGELQRAVTAYQRRIGLTPSGIANTRTLTMLNVPARQRIRQLQLNRDRIASLLPRAQDPRYVLVNIPAYELQAVENGRVALFSRVVVGKPETPTPEISASIKAINLLPYWHVPQSIAGRALIPKIKDDSLDGWRGPRRGLGRAISCA